MNGTGKFFLRKLYPELHFPVGAPVIGSYNIKGDDLRPESRPAEGKTSSALKFQHCTGTPGPNGAKLEIRTF